MVKPRDFRPVLDSTFEESKNKFGSTTCLGLDSVEIEKEESEPNRDEEGKEGEDGEWGGEGNGETEVGEEGDGETEGGLNLKNLSFNLGPQTRPWIYLAGRIGKDAKNSFKVGILTGQFDLSEFGDIVSSDEKFRRVDRLILGFLFLEVEPLKLVFPEGIVVDWFSGDWFLLWFGILVINNW